MKKRKRQLSINTLCKIILLPIVAVYGQGQDTTKIVKLNEIIVTATRSERNINDIGRNVAVITSNDIKNSGANTILELLNQKEGFYIVGAQQNTGSLSAIFTRGANGNHTVIMIDGVRITDPSSTDNSIDLSELSLAAIDRIEIVRGSHSALYGSSAIGGVINIITKKNNQTPGVHINADVRGGLFSSTGSVNSQNLSLNYTHKDGLYINAEVFNNSSEGFNSTIDTITNPLVYKHANMNDGFKKTDVIGKIGYKTKKFDVYAGVKNIVQKLDADDGAFRDDDNHTVRFNRNLISYGVSYRGNENFSVRFNGGISDMVRKAVDDSSRVDAIGTTDKSYSRNRYTGTLSNNELQSNFYLKGLQCVVGMSLDKETMSSEAYYFSNQWGVYEFKSDIDSLNINTTTSNVFLHADINGKLFNEVFNPYSLGLSARFVHHSAFGSTLIYEVNPSLKLKENTLLYLSYSTGFNAPSLYQLYSPEKDFTSGITRGNSTLKPEKSRAWEIGVKQKINDNLHWSVCYFNTTVENTVDFVYLWNKNQEIDSLSYLDYLGDTYINLGKQINKGIEFSIYSKLSNKFIVSGNFSLVNGKLIYNPENIDLTHTQGNHIQLFSNGSFIAKETESIGLVRRPNTANINLTYIPITNLVLRADVRYAGAKNDVYYNSSLGPYGALGTIGVEAYTLLDFSAKYEIEKDIAVTIRLENIFDATYYEIRGYNTRGRGFYSGISYSF